MATEAVELHQPSIPQAVLEGNPRIDGYVRDLTPIFSDPRVYPFLETLGQTVARRRQETKASGVIDMRSAIEEVQVILGLDDAETAQMKGKYDQIVLIFLPEIQRLARRKAKRSGGDFDEWQSIAAEKLTRNVVYFDWKTFEKDPQDTVDKFIKTTNKSLYDPDTHISVSDSRMIEVHPTFSEVVDRGSNVEEQVLENIERERLVRAIDAYSSSAQARRIIKSRIFEDLKVAEISRREGLSERQIDEIIKGFRDSLGTTVFPKYGNRRGWNEIFRKGPDIYRSLFEAKKEMLTPYYQEILQLFFELNTGDRNSTVDAIHAALASRGRKVSWNSVKRHVLGGLHVLDGKEKLQNGQCPLEKHRKKNIILRVSRDPNFFQSLSPQQQKVIECYLEALSLGKTPSQKDIARAMGVSEWTVSREIKRIERRYINSLELSRSNSGLAIDNDKANKLGY